MITKRMSEVHELVEDRKREAGRGEAGRMLAVLATKLEECIAWAERVQRLHPRAFGVEAAELAAARGDGGDEAVAAGAKVAGA